MTNDPQKYWVKMPEFDQPAKKPHAAINIRFATAEDLEKFIQITGLKLTAKTKSAWFPEFESDGSGMKRWK